MEDLPSSDLELELWALLGQARLAMIKVRRKELRIYHLSPNKSIVLLSIKVIGDKATPAQISRWLFREPHSISELLGRMEKEGLVKKFKDLDKKNQVRVMMTEKGHELYYQTLELESVRRMMSSLSSEQRQQLRSYLLTLRNSAVKELGTRYEIPFPAWK